MLPNRIFFTGVPGSRWSGIAQIIESIDGFNTSDRTPQRTYNHGKFSGHVGAYFGPGMELEPRLNAEYIDSAWTHSGGCRLIKSHEWSEMLPDVHSAFPEDWIMLIYRQTASSLKWWLEAGGYNISYPSYSAYQDMPAIVQRQNQGIMRWVFDKSCTLERFTSYWIQREFDQTVDFDHSNFEDIVVSLYKRKNK